VSSIINKSKWIVTVKRHPGLARSFSHYKAAEARAYKEKLLKENKVVADIVRGPLKLFVRHQIGGTCNAVVTRYRLVAHERFKLPI
jgi:hypothetical protein